MAYYGGWAPYVPVAKRRAHAAREVEKLRKAGRAIAAVVIEGRTIARTFWGKAWCDNLESYRDYENRLERGRTYVRNGSVVDLQVKPLEVSALVSGSSLYKISVKIAPLAKARWDALCRDCAGRIDSLVELLQGQFSKGVMERICNQEQGLFPKPADIKFSCSCPDSASMCKHVAATLYGIGARFDASPELLFQLRGVDAKDLVANIDTALPLSKTGPAAGRVLATDDLSAMFGLDMAGPEEGPVAVPSARAEKPKGAVPAIPAPKARAAPAKPAPGQAPAGKSLASKPVSAPKGPASKGLPSKALAPKPSAAPTPVFVAPAPAPMKAPTKAAAEQAPAALPASLHAALEKLLKAAPSKPVVAPKPVGSPAPKVILTKSAAAKIRAAKSAARLAAAKVAAAEPPKARKAAAKAKPALPAAVAPTQAAVMPPPSPPKRKAAKPSGKARQ